MKRFHAVSSSAFSLVEVVLALGVTSFCLMALFGLLSIGLRSNQSTIQQAGATAILAAAVSDLYAAPHTFPPGQGTNSIQYKIKIPANPITAASATAAVTTLFFPDNSLSTNPPTVPSTYRLTITPIVPSPAGGAKTATFYNLKVTWPASVSVTSAAGIAEVFVALNRN